MTGQVPDWIRYQGNGYRLWSGPNLPSGLCDLEFVSQSSANWRGFIAHWFVEDDFPYLAALAGGVSLHRTLPIVNCQITPQDGGLAAE